MLTFATRSAVSAAAASALSDSACWPHPCAKTLCRRLWAVLEVRAWAVVLFESCGEEATQRWNEPPEHGVVLLSVPVIVGEDDGEEACDVPDEGLEDLPDEDDGTETRECSIVPGTRLPAPVQTPCHCAERELSYPGAHGSSGAESAQWT